MTANFPHNCLQPHERERTQSADVSPRCGREKVGGASACMFNIAVHASFKHLHTIAPLIQHIHSVICAVDGKHRRKQAQTVETSEPLQTAVPAACCQMQSAAPHKTGSANISFHLATQRENAGTQPHSVKT